MISKATVCKQLAQINYIESAEQTQTHSRWIGIVPSVLSSEPKCFAEKIDKEMTVNEKWTDTEFD